MDGSREIRIELVKRLWRLLLGPGGAWVRGMFEGAFRSECGAGGEREGEGFRGECREGGRRCGECDVP